jgi:hypothetical protein
MSVERIAMKVCLVTSFNAGRMAGSPKLCPAGTIVSAVAFAKAEKFIPPKQFHFLRKFSEALSNSSPYSVPNFNSVESTNVENSL